MAAPVAGVEMGNVAAHDAAGQGAVAGVRPYNSHMIVHRDLAYAAASPAQRLDLYRPGAQSAPLVLWVHGGGWLTGSRALRDAAPQLRLVERGFALASVGYRLSHEAHFPAQIHDVKAAVRWLRANAAAHGLDARRLAVWGASAGGHLAALLGTSAGVSDLEGPELGCSSESSRVDMVIDWFGPTDFLAMDEQTAAAGCRPFRGTGHDAPDSPESLLMGFPITARPDAVRATDPATYVHADLPPFLLQHGTRDCTVPWQQSQYLAEAVNAAAGEGRAVVELLEGSHGGPAFDDALNIDRVIDFIELHLAAAS